MYGQIRYGQRFIKKSKLNRIMRIKNLNKKTPSAEENEVKNEIQMKLNAANETRVEGRRFVDIVELGKNLKCTNCSGILSLDNINREHRDAYNSIFYINCKNCNHENKVHTSKKQEVIISYKKGGCSKKRKSIFNDNTTMLVLGKFYFLVHYTFRNRVFRIVMYMS